MGIRDRIRNLALWKKVYLILAIVFLVIPYSLMFYPPLTGPVVYYFASPPMMVVWVGPIILVWVSLFKKYGFFKRFSKPDDEDE